MLMRPHVDSMLTNESNCRDHVRFKLSSGYCYAIALKMEMYTMRTLKLIRFFKNYKNIIIFTKYSGQITLKHKPKIYYNFNVNKIHSLQRYNVN